MKLSTELAKRSLGRNLYILDEPTTGLHREDVKHLLAVLERLVDAGNSVIVVEHNLDVIKSADHIIDLGPEGGEEGVASLPREHRRKWPAARLPTLVNFFGRFWMKTAGEAIKGWL